MLGESANAASGLVVWALKLSGISTSWFVAPGVADRSVLGIDLFRRRLHVDGLLHLRPAIRTDRRARFGELPIPPWWSETWRTLPWRPTSGIVPGLQVLEQEIGVVIAERGAGGIFVHIVERDQGLRKGEA